MATEIERERAYDLPDGVTVPDLTGRAGIADVAGARSDVLETTYHDTPDLRLARARTALRHRRGGEDAGWHLKMRLTDERRTEEQRPDSEEAPPDLLERVRATARGQALQPVAQVVTRRRERQLRDRQGRVLALLAEDDVQAEDLLGGASHSWRELEIELVDGDEALFGQLEPALRSAGAQPLAASKLERTLADRLDTARAPAVSGRAAAAVFDYLRAQRDALVAEYPGARGGDADAVHDMRVATRRLRAILRTFRGLWDRRRVDAVRRDLSWLGHRLGALRDGQVMADRLAAAVQAEPPELVIGPVAARVQQRYAGEAGEAHTRLREALDSRRYLDLLIALDDLVDTPPPHRHGNRWARKRARRTLSRADEALDTALAHRDLPGGRAPTGLTGNELLHEARKAYKKGRYAAEALAVVGDKPAKRLIKRLKAVQDTLGDHHDTVTARAELRQQAMRAYRDRDNTFTYGLLYARADDSARQALREVEPAVRRARSRKVRRWLD